MKKISEIQKGLSLNEKLNLSDLTELKGGKRSDDKRRNVQVVAQLQPAQAALTYHFFWVKLNFN